MNPILRVHHPTFIFRNLQHCRTLSYNIQNAVNLKYTLYEPKKLLDGHHHLIDATCILIHGLLGNRNNLRIFTRLLPFKQFVLPDLRNHGSSPRSNSMSSVDLASDILCLMDHLRLENVALVGHSLGGRIAMAVALLEPKRVTHAAILDMAPVDLSNINNSNGLYLDTPRFSLYQTLKLLNTIPLNTLKTPADVKYWLIEQASQYKPYSEKFLSLVTGNLKLTKRNTLEWKPNLSVLVDRFFKDILSWPFEDERYISGPIVFIKGSESFMVPLEHDTLIYKYFPKASITSVKAGHWLHVEAPETVAFHIRDAWKL